MQPLKAIVDEGIIETHSSFFLDSPRKERSKEKGEAPIPEELSH
jgi:hypothetical protein